MLELDLTILIQALGEGVVFPTGLLGLGWSRFNTWSRPLSCILKVVRRFLLLCLNNHNCNGIKIISYFIFQVSAALDAAMELAAGKVNIHVLMALAAFASVFMGNPLEGGLLLAMFNLAHIGKYETVNSFGH